MGSRSIVGDPTLEAKPIGGVSIAQGLVAIKGAGGAPWHFLQFSGHSLAWSIWFANPPPWSPFSISMHDTFDRGALWPTNEGWS